MPNPHDDLTDTLNLLHSELATVLSKAVQIALHESALAVTLVRKVEAQGYQVRTAFDYTVHAVPLELVFDESLNEADRIFLREPAREIPSGKAIGETGCLDHDRHRER